MPICRMNRLAGALMAALLLSATAASAQAQWLVLDWKITNNFALLRGQATQARFAAEAEAYIECIRRTGSVTSCSDAHPAEGLTQRAYPTRFDAKTFSYQRDLLRPTRGVHQPGLSTADRIDVLVTVEGAPADATCTWTLDGHVFRDQSCERLAITTQFDEVSDVSVTVNGRPDLRGLTRVQARRVIVLAMGDSFISGEGNPHMRRRLNPLRGENWLEARCHRSLLTSTSLGALRYAQMNPKVYVAYLNLACSGSTVETGLLGRYGGVKTVNALANDRSPDDPLDFSRAASLPSQIDQATAALCETVPGKPRRCLAPDLVVLGIGVNDLRFSTIVSTLVTNTCGPSCLANLERTVDAGLKRLTGTGTGSLAKAMNTIDRSLAPRRVITLAYPDPTRNDDGGACSGSVVSRSFSSLGLIDSRESQWASERVVIRLNAAIATATAGRAGWTFDQAAVAASATHGFCARRPHYTSALEAAGDTGTLHPNAAGHAAVAATLLDTLEAILAAPEQP